MSQVPAFRSMSMFDDFESLLKEYEPMIYHLLSKYQVNDPEKEYYQELAITLWKASRDYRPSQMKFSTYAYSRMNFRLIRSEEHTSELQSRGHLVCRLLLEKKNK